MTVKRRARNGGLWSLLVALGLALLGGTARAVAAPVGGDHWQVKYYVVGDSYRGEPENLSEIASRFLGTVDRAAEVFDLNAGRVQPDGGKLTDPHVLRPGWRIVLPWDAVGPGVQYGVLPSSVSKSTQGNGVLVAVVDSGVDGGVAELSGRVAVGADITSGTSGDDDVLGSGTFMASIIAASADDGDPIGIAPAATILPVRVVAEKPGANAKPMANAADAATGIEVAISAGAKVIALGSYVDLGAPAVAAAVDTASAHDVLIVAGAPTADADGGAGSASPAQSSTLDALLRTGGVDKAKKPAQRYRSGGVDVVAPGVGVSSLGTGNTGARSVSGTQYATAFVAGVAALVRSAYPRLTAAQAARRVRATATALGGAVPDARTGWGMVSAESAVTKVLPDEDHDIPAATTTGNGNAGNGNASNGNAGNVAGPTLIGVAMVGVLTVAALALRARRRT